MEEKYPGLAELCGNYLHQDYKISGGTLEDAVRDFIENTPEPTLLAASHDIDRLVDAALSEYQVERVLDAMGLSVHVKACGWPSYGSWLASVKEGVWKELNRRAAEGGLPPEEWEEEDKSSDT
jgi:hypothetical protein